MAPRVIDIGGLSEAELALLERQAELFRRQRAAKKAKPAPELPVCNGGVIGHLSREELYEDDE